MCVYVYHNNVYGAPAHHSSDLDTVVDSGHRSKRLGNPRSVIKDENMSDPDRLEIDSRDVTEVEDIHKSHPYT